MQGYSLKLEREIAKHTYSINLTIPKYVFNSRVNFFYNNIPKKRRYQ
jgi:hypothetical protein